MTVQRRCQCLLQRLGIVTGVANLNRSKILNLNKVSSSFRVLSARTTVFGLEHLAAVPQEGEAGAAPASIGKVAGGLRTLKQFD